MTKNSNDQNKAVFFGKVGSVLANREVEAAWVQLITASTNCWIVSKHLKSSKQVVSVVIPLQFGKVCSGVAFNFTQMALRQFT